MRFEGSLFRKEPGKGGSTPTFTASVADLDLAFPKLTNVHDIGEANAEEPYGGLGTRVILDSHTFPAQWPVGAAKEILEVNLHLNWTGPPESPPTFGTITLGPVGGEAVGVKLYEHEDVAAFGGSVTITPTELDGGVFSRKYRVVTNSNFTDSAIIEGVFEWDSSLAGSTQDDKAKDQVRLMLYWVDFVTDSDNSVVLHRDQDERALSNIPPGKYLTYVEGASRVEVGVDTWLMEAGVTGKLWSPNNGAGLQVWLHDTGGAWAEVPLGTTWDLSTLQHPPNPLWVAATEAGQSELRFSLYDAAGTELNGQTLVFTGLAGAVSNSGWDYWTEMKDVGLFGQPKVGGVPLTAEELADDTVPHWRELPEAVRGTPIPPDQHPENRFTSPGTSFRTLATNYADGKQGTAVEVIVWWRIGDTHSAWPKPDTNPPDRDSYQYYGNSGVFLFNQYEVQIVDARNYSLPNGDEIEVDADGNLIHSEAYLGGRQPTAEELQKLRDGRKPYPPTPAARAIPGGLYGQAQSDTDRHLNHMKEGGEWNKLSIRFWPKTADKAAYIQTWLNGTMVMNDVAHPTSKRWGEGDINIQRSGGIYLQSHWGSNVEFRSPVVQYNDHPRPN